MDPTQKSWNLHERSMNPVSSAGYEGPPPCYSESTKPPPLTGKTLYPPGVNQSLSIPTTLPYSQGSPPPYSASPQETTYVCTPYPSLQPTMAVTGLPLNDGITREPPLSPPITNDHMSFSILSLFLCFPLGVVALIYSFKSRSATKRGDLSGAVEASQKAFFLNRISRFGLLIIITLVSILIFYFVRTAGSWFG